MRRHIGLILVFISFILLPLAGFAYSSNICKGSTCAESEVGAFMKGITQECGNFGNCSICDILLVFANTGNFVIGIVGSLVLLMYVIGGFYWLTSHGDSGKVTKGKEFLKISTTGLVIVLVAYAAIHTIIETIAPGYGDKSTGGCGTAADEGKPCGEYSIYKGGICMSLCAAKIDEKFSCKPEGGPGEYCSVDTKVCPSGQKCCGISGKK